MRVIVAGSRWITSLPMVARAIQESGFKVTEIVSGGAKGVDRLGEVWAGYEGVPVKRFNADWSLGPKAGPLRNREMAAYADALVAVWDGESRGTASMIKAAQRKGIPFYIERVWPASRPQRERK